MKKILMGFISLLVILVGCNEKDQVESLIYQGERLNIGVIGEAVDVREQNVNFESLTLDKLESDVKSISTEFDAIFIMKEYLIEAGEKQYANMYSELGIPVFFIQSKKSYLPFINEDMTYEEAPNIEDQTYATGISSEEKDAFKYWGYGLYNDTENETNIKDVYSRIFTTIESEVK